MDAKSCPLHPHAVARLPRLNDASPLPPLNVNKLLDSPTEHRMTELRTTELRMTQLRKTQLRTTEL